MNSNNEEIPRPPILTEADIDQAMADLDGFIDITTEHFEEIYLHAYLHAKKRLKQIPVPPQPKIIEDRGLLLNYLYKMNGGGKSPIKVSNTEIVWSWIGSFFGILAVAFINYKIFASSDLIMLIGSFGASAVLIYGAIKSPLAQPRNLVGGHFLSALVGVSVLQFFPENLWLASSLAVSLAIVLMHLTKTLHPPGGATALIAVIGSEKIHSLGFLYALIPVLFGALIMLLIAIIVNNIPKTRRYPEYWF